MTHRTVRLTADELAVLGHALEFYIRLGLGQFGEMTTRFDLIHGDRLTPEQMAAIRRLGQEMESVAGEGEPWRLYDPETSLHTLVAFGLEGKLTRNREQVRWAVQHIKDREASGERIDHRERGTAP